MQLMTHVKWQERYASFGLNRKLAGVLTPGVYWGFALSPGPAGGGLAVHVSPAGEDYPASVAVVEREGYSLTLRMEGVAELPVPGPGVWYPVLEAYYTPGQETSQELKLVAEPLAHHVVLGTIDVPADATTVTTAMISDAGRMVGNPALMILGFTTALVDNEVELLAYKRRLANLENWAAAKGYNPAALYS